MFESCHSCRRAYYIIGLFLLYALTRCSSAQTTDSATADDDNPTATESSNPLADLTFYVDPESDAAEQVAAWNLTNPTDAALLAQISAQPVAKWMGDWYDDIESAADEYTTEITDVGDTPLFVAYNIPDRDCGSYSAGGADDSQAYLTWIEQFADGIGSRPAVVILEPDAAALTSCLTDDQTAERLSLLSSAVSVLKAKAAIIVYIDAGNANWIDASTMAEILLSAGIAEADGFALNVSNFYTNEESIAYGESVSVLVEDKHFVIDTSRNGNGSNGEWCNPSGREIGTAPTTSTGNELVDAFLWIKVPGESDGTCNSGPDAGDWWLDYAMDLVDGL